MVNGKYKFYMTIIHLYNVDHNTPIQSLFNATVFRKLLPITHESQTNKKFHLHSSSNNVIWSILKTLIGLVMMLN